MVQIKVIERLKSLFYNKEIKNTGWIIGGKVAQMALSLIVGIWSARYLGPSNYGLLNYVSAYTAFFTSLCTLGITSSVLVNEFTQRPDEEGTTLGTTIGLRLISSVLSAIMIVSIVYIVDDGDPLLLWIAIFSSAGLIFNVFDVIEFWFFKALYVESHCHRVICRLLCDIRVQDISADNREKRSLFCCCDFRGLLSYCDRSFCGVQKE